MINEEWIKNNLADYLEEDIDRQVIRLTSGNKVSINNFLEFFGGINNNYEDLISAGEKKGYVPFFDELKEKGILEWNNSKKM